MKKEKVMLIALFLIGVLAGGTFLHWRSEAAPASSVESFEVVNKSLTYGGVYIDLVEQAKIDADLEERQNALDPNGSEPYMVKYNVETGYVDGITTTGAGITDRQLSFVYEGVQLDLHFINDVLIGCRKTYEQELTDQLSDQVLACTTEEREAAELETLEIILDNDSWETDEDYLKLVLADYTEQVLEYQSEHPGVVDSSK